jgi:peptidoglycan/xylan/chitin deacetylase (PgdA/CDA1 family)
VAAEAPARGVAPHDAARRGATRRRIGAAVLAAAGAWLVPGRGARPAAAQGAHAPHCPAGTLYLTIDTGWSREAERIADILRRRGVRATLFVADEPTWRGDSTLSDAWRDFWRARAAEGHVFASHTWRHWYFRADAGPGRVRYVARGGGAAVLLDQAGLCEELERPIRRLREMVPEAQVLPLWRAPGGITTPGALAMARACGLTHQGWTAHGFLGDELPSDRHPNAALLRRALRDVRDGEVLVMHWGVRSRREPFVEVLEPLIEALQAKGFCFDTLPPQGR